MAFQRVLNLEKTNKSKKIMDFMDFHGLKCSSFLKGQFYPGQFSGSLMGGMLKSTGSRLITFSLFWSRTQVNSLVLRRRHFSTMSE